MKNASDFSGAFLFPNHLCLDVQVKLDIFIAIKQLVRFLLIVFVYVYISEIQRYAFQREIYLSGH